MMIAYIVITANAFLLGYGHIIIVESLCINLQTSKYCFGGKMCPSSLTALWDISDVNFFK